MKKLFRALCWGMAVLCGFGAVVQFNDPDPLVWIAVYTATSVLSVVAAVRGWAPPLPSALVATLTFAWVAGLARDVPAEAYGTMFDDWEMSAASSEEAREATGLLVLGVWTAMLTLHGRATQMRRSIYR